MDTGRDHPSGSPSAAFRCFEAFGYGVYADRGRSK